IAPVTRPSFPTSILRTYDFGRISQRPVFTAAGTSAAKVLDFAPTSHPKASQYPQCTQAARPRYCCEMIASGAGNGCRPSFFAPRSNNTPDDFTGMGGNGYGFDRGPSNGFDPPKPDIRRSHSALV